MTLHVFWIFLRLGLTSFGGPVAHIGYFRSEFVERRRLRAALAGVNARWWASWRRRCGRR